jgi:hypothetical protein
LLPFATTFPIRQELAQNDQSSARATLVRSELPYIARTNSGSRRNISLADIASRRFLAPEKSATADVDIFWEALS